MPKKKINFPNKKSLKPIEEVLKEVELGFENKSRTIETSAMKNPLTKVKEAIGNGNKKIDAKYLLLLFGGLVYGLPGAIGAGMVFAKKNSQDFVKEKQRLFSECKNQKEKIQTAMDWGEISEDRKEYLGTLMTLLDNWMALLNEDLIND